VSGFGWGGTITGVVSFEVCVDPTQNLALKTKGCAAESINCADIKGAALAEFKNCGIRDVVSPIKSVRFRSHHLLLL
jgi:hypothetical protein